MGGVTPPFAAAGPVGTIVFPLILLAYWIPYHRRARTLAAQGRPVETWRQWMLPSYVE